MSKGQDIADAVVRHWRPIVLLFWLCTGIYLIWKGWGAPGAYGIQGFGLGDTDDNLRIMQVRAWYLHDQSWYDLRQYRLSPPDGANIHWSRLVDLPIAGLWWLFGWFMDGPAAERWAVAIAPLFPLLVVMGALALTARRLLAASAYWLPLILVLCGGSALAQFAPLRIDHHGWQLAMLAVVLCGLADSDKVRGGITMGVASALSLVIGLELLLYLAVAGAAVGLFWVSDRDEARRLSAYGVSFAGAATIGFLIFASNDNWAPMCDALSPVWLSVVLAAGAVALALAWTNPRSVAMRLFYAAIGGIILVGFYALSWPDCVGRLERVPEELDRLWLGNVREAMPIWRHGLNTTVATVSLPLFGLIGAIVMLWRTRRDPQAFRCWAALGYLGALAMALLLWQTRAAAASQLLAVPGAAALCWVAITWFQRQRSAILRLAALGSAILVIGGIALGEASGWWNEDAPPSEYQQKVNNANWRCPQPWALHPVNQQPRGRVLTFVDMGPRLVTLTHHDAIAGPYHRNVDAILDVMHAFRGDTATAKEIIDRRQIDYVLLCPNMSESTIYRADAPQGFYVQLMVGRVPDWLEPIDMPKMSGGEDWPFRMWRVRR